MTNEARRLLKEALKLPVGVRATFAGTLIRSLDEQVDANAAAAWDREIRRRIAELDSGKARLISWSEVRRKLRSPRNAAP